MVPFDVFTSIRWKTVLSSLGHIGGVSTVEISGSPANGVRPGEAIAAMEELVSSMDGCYAAA